MKAKKIFCTICNGASCKQCNNSGFKTEQIKNIKDKKAVLKSSRRLNPFLDSSFMFRKVKMPDGFKDNCPCKSCKDFRESLCKPEENKTASSIEEELNKLNKEFKDSIKK